MWQIEQILISHSAFLLIKVQYTPNRMNLRYFKNIVQFRMKNARLEAGGKSNACWNCIQHVLLHFYREQSMEICITDFIVHWKNKNN